ncbi:hypothetical protein QQ045_012317 [Rhodiola kirilowii]
MSLPFSFWVFRLVCRVNGAVRLLSSVRLTSGLMAGGGWTGSVGRRSGRSRALVFGSGWTAWVAMGLGLGSVVDRCFREAATVGGVSAS